MRIVPQHAREGFDYKHGGFELNATQSIAHTIYELHKAGIVAVVEHSGDLFRLWMPDHEDYYWPVDESDKAWTLNTGDGK